MKNKKEIAESLPLFVNILNAAWAMLYDLGMYFHDNKFREVVDFLRKAVSSFQQAINMRLSRL